MANDTAVGTYTWGSPDNSKVSDNTYSSVSWSLTGIFYTYYLKATNFGFAIPSGATINGVTVSIERKASHSASSRRVNDSIIKLVKGGTVSGDNKSAGAQWPTTEATDTFGGASDLWGLTLTDTDVNDSTFGVVLSAQILKPVGKGLSSGSVDFISITITYTEGGGGGVPKQMVQYARARKTR